MMQTVLGNSSKVLVDQKSGSNLLYLPLDKLIQQIGGAGAERRDARRRRACRRAPPTPDAALATRSDARSRDALRNRDGSAAMKFAMPILAARRRAAARRVAVALHGRPAQVRDQVPARRVRRDEDRRRASTSRCRWCRTCKFYDKRNLTLDNPEPDRDDDVGEEAAARRLRRAVADHRRARSTTSRCRATRKPRGARLSQTVRANLAEEFNKRDVHEAISSARDEIMIGDAAEGRTPTRSRSASRSSTCGCAASSCRPT